jgi:hypothetical protein
VRLLKKLKHRLHYASCIDVRRLITGRLGLNEVCCDSDCKRPSRPPRADYSVSRCQLRRWRRLSLRSHRRSNLHIESQRVVQGAAGWRIGGATTASGCTLSSALSVQCGKVPEAFSVPGNTRSRNATPIARLATASEIQSAIAARA